VTVITIFLTGRANLNLEREKFVSNSMLERQKCESSLILQAIATGDQNLALKNLHFLVQAGFLADPGDRIKNLQPQEAPVLPAGRPIERGPTYRRSIRTGADPGASLVDETPVITTIEELVEKSRPQAREDRRSDSVERSVFKVDAELFASRLVYGYYRLYVRGASGQTMWASCPDPQNVDPKSRWARQIAAMRSDIRKRLNPQDVRTFHEGQHVRITGVGFFNEYHGQWGIAPNCIELSPILDIEWLGDKKAG
jgi:hypothetical protein